MSNAMRFGKRSLAGLASGALLLSGIAIVAAQPAQAAGVTTVYCNVTNGTGFTGSAGTGGDPTSVRPDCTSQAGTTASPQVVAIGQSTVFSTATPGSTILTLSGAGAYFSAWNGTRTNSLPVTLGATVTQVVIDNSDALTATGMVSVSLPQSGTVTVTVQNSTSDPAGVTPSNTTTQGTFAIVATGAPANWVITPMYKSILNGDDSAAVAFVQRTDSNGTPVPTLVSDVNLVIPSPAPGTYAPRQSGGYATDCTNTGGAGDTVLDVWNPGNSGNNELPYRNICRAIVAAGGAASAGVYVVAQATGFANINLGITDAAGTVIGSASFAQAALAGASYTLTLDKSAYLPGAPAVATFNIVDFGGRPVPDGLGWVAQTERQMSVSWNADTICLGGAPLTAGTGCPGTAPVTAVANLNVPTYDGKALVDLVVPQRAMLWTMASESSTAGAWAASGQGLARSVSAPVGEVPPVEKEIMIVGTRGIGDDANRVYVEGRTKGMVGKVVTPYVRFPGETGFTMGTGVRTVDADGNFAWQRKTGKKIAVQFRGEGEISNTVIIDAK